MEFPFIEIRGMGVVRGMGELIKSFAGHINFQIFLGFQMESTNRS